MQPSANIADLLTLMAALRDPDNGCPWDLKQSLSTIAPYTIEEAYEVADAVERGDMQDLCDELGDLLLQVVFFAQMTKEAGDFDFGDVVRSITSKLIRRHPHMFGERTAATAEEVRAIWDEVKSQEKEETQESLLDDIPLALPALQRAVKLQQKAGTVGFDWNNPRSVLTKLREEIDEFERELDGGNKQREAEELGDILFALANLARHRKIDPEQALRGASQKFVRRFAFIENELKKDGRTALQASLDEMETLWNKVKMQEKKISQPL